MVEIIGEAAKEVDRQYAIGVDGWQGVEVFTLLAGLLDKQIAKISAVEQCLQHAVCFSLGIAFSQALLRNKLEPDLKLQDYEDFRRTLAGFLSSKRQIHGFSIAEFKNSQLVQDVENLLNQLLDKALLENSARNRIKRFISDYGKINFLQLLECNEAVRAILASRSGPPSSKLALKHLQLEKYYCKLRNLYTEITLDDDKGMTLDRIYVEPRFKVYEHCLERGTFKKDKNIFISQDEILIGLNIHELVLNWLQGKALPKPFRNPFPKLILICAYPGQGKTSFCKRLLHDLAHDYPLPYSHFYTQFQNFVDPTCLKTDFLEGVARHFQNSLELSVDLEDLKTSFLLLDGLDELYMKEGLDPSAVEDILKNLSIEINRSQKLKALITSRYGYVENRKLDGNQVLILQLDELNLKQQKDLLGRYREFHSETWLHDNALEELSLSNQYLAELVTQPILLQLVARLNAPIEKVANRAKVYESLFLQVTDRNWERNHSNVLRGIEASVLRNYLRELAYEIFLSGEKYITIPKLEELSATQIFRKNLKEDSLETTMQALLASFFFQKVRNTMGNSVQEYSPEYAIEFLHPTLQEYLTAERIWFKIKREFLTKRHGDYILSDRDEALALFQQLFGKRFMTKEVLDYLREIITNDERRNDKEDLVKRLLTFTDFFLQRDFISREHAVENKRPLDISIQVFSGFFSLLVYLNPNINLFDSLQDEYRLSLFLHLWTPFSILKLNLPGIYLPKANLKGLRFVKPDLSFSNLSGSDLRKTDLDYANLSHADLRKVRAVYSSLSFSNLSHADLRDADLTKANLMGVNLFSADLSFADLRKADFTRAYLMKADFSGCNLNGANLTGADLRDSNLQGASLQNANLKNTLIDIKQLQATGSLYNCLGIEEDIAEALKIENPKLFSRKVWKRNRINLDNQ
ncbi:MAG: hypothetical protein F6K19_13575 [Cyanothece sp. SIO1E1]|nr:hypothetical protein [Cyanothece sp. SIO1E1]